jgi:hypothetical protein
VSEEILDLESHADDYAKFLASKRILAAPCGFAVKDADLNPMLMPFQRDIAKWALRRGKAAVFAHTGLGKGPIQLDWCRLVSKRAKRPTMILAPLAVAQQFQREAEKFSVPITLCESDGDVSKGVNVTNYEKIGAFDLARFAGISLDESSCIKDWTSKTTQTLIEQLKDTPYKLCCTATPSPNDHSELGTHAEILDVMRRPAMLAMFFEHDGKNTSAWVLKGHGRKPFFKFVASWAVCIMKPSDLGYPDEGFDLPPLYRHEHIVPVDHSVNTEGMLFRCPDMSATGLHKEMRLTAAARAAKVAELVNAKPGVPWLIWCNTDYESGELLKALPDVVEVRGPDSPAKKICAIMGFCDGNINQLLSKLSIFGWGLNLQHCRDMAFVGLSYSFEAIFQGIRRCWRFGQTQPVHAHLVMAETEGAVMESLRRKEKQYNELQSEMNTAMKEEQLAARHKAKRYEHLKEIEVPAWLSSTSA